MLIGSVSFSQQFDNSRMDRDLEVAKNVLQTLLGQGTNQFFWGRNIEATYLEGYGVIFTLPENLSYVAFKAPRADKKWNRMSGMYTDTEVFEFGEDSVFMERHKQKKEAVITFLADYSDLIGQLQPDDNIKVHSKSGNDIFYVGVLGDDNWSIGGNEGFSAEIKRKEVNSYKEGKISRDELVNRITFTDSNSSKKYPDLELFASIVKRLYSPDLSETFFTDRTPTYEILKDFGVIFYMKTYSSYSSRDELYRMPVLARSDVNLEERNETIIKLYPDFERSLKETMIEYGRTIKSLDESGVLMFKVKLTKCDGCDIPESIDASVSKSVLTQYDQRKIGLDEAMQKIKIRKNPQDKP